MRRWNLEGRFCFPRRGWLYIRLVSIIKWRDSESKEYTLYFCYYHECDILTTFDTIITMIDPCVIVWLFPIENNYIRIPVNPTRVALYFPNLRFRLMWSCKIIEEGTTVVTRVRVTGRSSTEDVSDVLFRDPYRSEGVRKSCDEKGSLGIIQLLNTTL